MAINKSSSSGKTTGLATSSDIGQAITAIIAGFQTVSPSLKVTNYELTNPDALTDFDLVTPSSGGSASVVDGIIKIVSPHTYGMVNLYSKKAFSLPLQAMFAVWTAYGSVADSTNPLEIGFVSVDPVTGNTDFSNYVSISATEYDSTTTLTLYTSAVRVCNNNNLITKYFSKQLNDQHAESQQPPPPYDQTWYAGIGQLTINHKGVFFDYGTSGMATHDQRADYFEQLPDMTRQYKFFIKFTGGYDSPLNFGFLRVFESGAPRLPLEVVAYNKIPVYYPEPPNVVVSGNVSLNPGGVVGVVNSGRTAFGVTVQNTALTVMPYQAWTYGFAGNSNGQDLRSAQAANVIVNLPYKNALIINLPGQQVKMIRWAIYVDQPATVQVQASDDARVWLNDPDFLITLLPGRPNKIEYNMFFKIARLQFINGSSPQSYNLNIQYALFC